MSRTVIAAVVAVVIAALTLRLHSFGQLAFQLFHFFAQLFALLAERLHHLQQLIQLIEFSIILNRLVQAEVRPMVVFIVSVEIKILILLKKFL